MDNIGNLVVDNIAKLVVENTSKLIPKKRAITRQQLIITVFGLAISLFKKFNAQVK